MAGVDNYLGYFGLSALLLTAGLVIYARITPYHEMALIRGGNTAAAYSLGGTALGLAAAIASAAAHSLNLWDMAVWAGIAVLAQVLLFLVVGRLLPDLRAAIEADRSAAGIFLGALSLAVGVLNAGCLTY